MCFAYSSAVPTSWEIMMIAIFCSRLICSIVRYSSRATMGSSPAVGSSMRRSFCVAQSARASKTLCFCPPDDSHEASGFSSALLPAPQASRLRAVCRPLTGTAACRGCLIPRAISVTEAGKSRWDWFCWGR